MSKLRLLFIHPHLFRTHADPRCQGVGRNSTRNAASSDLEHFGTQGISPLQLANAHDNIVAPILDSLLPQPHLQPAPQWSGALTKGDQLSAAYLKLLIYAATNNLAGVEVLVTLPMMYDYLNPMIAKFLEMNAKGMAFLGFTKANPSLKPMAETFFRCAVYMGDSGAIRALCQCKELGIDVNTQVIAVQGRRYSPLEIAAQRRFLHATEVLICLGADLHQTFEIVEKPDMDVDGILDRNVRSRSPRGALEHAVHQEPIHAPMDRNIVTCLLQHGGTIATERLLRLLKHGLLDCVQIIVEYRLPDDHSEWTQKGLFHTLLQKMSHEACIRVIKQMQAVGVDYNIAVFVDKDKPVVIVPRHPPHYDRRRNRARRL